MKFSNLPQPVMAKLLDLQERVEDLVRDADQAERTMMRARGVINGNVEVEPGEYETARASFNVVHAESKAARMKADGGRILVQAIKNWIEGLHHNTRLTVVQSNGGGDLAAMSAKLKALRSELHTINHTTPVADDIETRVAGYVNDLASRGAPFVRGYGQHESLDVRWPDGIDPNPMNGNTLSGNGLVMAALLMPAELGAAIAGAIHEAQPIPKDELAKRRAELMSEIDETSYACAALLDKAGELPDAAMEPWHVLSVRIGRPAEAMQVAV